MLQKQNIVQEYSHHKRCNAKATQPALDGWAEETFDLEQIPSKYVIRRTFRDANEFTKIHANESSSRKRQKEAAEPRVEDALFCWVCDNNNDIVSLNSAVIRHHGERLLGNADRLLPEDHKINLKFWKGWLERFKDRFELRFRRVHGEALSADHDAIRNQMPCLLPIIATYQLADIWNADEFGLFYRQPPCSKMSHRPVSGFKKGKARILFLACCNNDGSERMPLMIIGYTNKASSDLRFDYYSNRKGSMTKEPFFEWLYR